MALFINIFLTLLLERERGGAKKERERVVLKTFRYIIITIYLYISPGVDLDWVPTVHPPYKLLYWALSIPLLAGSS